MPAARIVVGRPIGLLVGEVLKQVPRPCKINVMMAAPRVTVMRVYRQCVVIRFCIAGDGNIRWPAFARKDLSKVLKFYWLARKFLANYAHEISLADK
jgi:hypothetical protein